MKMKRLITAALLLVLFSGPVLAKDRVSGTLVFGPSCPDDTIKSSANEAFALALLSPLLAGVINQGLKTAGAKLTEAAQEKNVDVIHRGGHLYQWGKDPGGKERFELGFGCLVVASRGMVKSNRTLADLVAGYKPAEVTFKASGFQKTPIKDQGELVKLLEQAGFSDALLPGIVGVFDVELSAQRGAGRLVPRFVVMDHSIREKKVDSKERTLTFELSMTAPTLSKPFAQSLIKLEKLAIAKPFEQNPLRPVTSSWFPVPVPDSQTAARLKSFQESKQILEVDLRTIEFAGKAAVALNDPNIAGFLQGKPPCPTKEEALERWATEHKNLEVEKAKPKEEQDDLPRLTNAVLYYKTCHKFQGVTTEVAEARKLLAGGTGPFDVTVTIKEFRKRPFAEFFGAVLGSDTTRSGLTSALVSAIDPKAQKDEEEKKEEEALAARQAYEDAIVAAEIATANYDAAIADGKPAAAAHVDMEAKKRTANRRAEALRLPLPYPTSGVWFG